MTGNHALLVSPVCVCGLTSAGCTFSLQLYIVILCIGLFDEENIPWLLDLLKNDVLRVESEKVAKEQFSQVRGDSQDKNAFWKAVSAIAVEKFNMKEVFNMNSTVRLTAIEKLGMFVS